MGRVCVAGKQTLPLGLCASLFSGGVSDTRSFFFNTHRIRSVRVFIMLAKPGNDDRSDVFLKKENGGRIRSVRFS